MKTDIFRKIEKDFSVESKLALEKIEALDAKTKGLVSDRLIRALVYLANGNVDKLEYFIKSARKDYRDILFWAEYNESEEHIFDFNKSFDELGLF